MSTPVFVASKPESALDSFAADLREGLGSNGQKSIPATYLYDSIGSALFEAITLLPEYGLTRADESLLRAHSSDIAARCGRDVLVAELGSGGGSKTRIILQAVGSKSTIYYPIDVSRSALERCVSELDPYAEVRPVQGSYLEGLERVLAERNAGQRLLLLFLGSTIGNFSPPAAAAFLQQIHDLMSPGDFLLIGADLVKPVPVMLAAYDDPTGITAAFNRNLLARVNRELGAEFDIRGFHHEVRWTGHPSCIEMHLRAGYSHTVPIPGAGIEVKFRSGETIWTESSHKFTPATLREMAERAGFHFEECWIDKDWPFAECLWAV
jgi:L-histidine Nalpha-methyltransferase